MHLRVLLFVLLSGLLVLGRQTLKCYRQPVLVKPVRVFHDKQLSSRVGLHDAAILWLSPHSDKGWVKPGTLPIPATKGQLEETFKVLPMWDIIFTFACSHASQAMSSAVVHLVNVLQEATEANTAMAWPSEGLLVQFEGESPRDFVASHPEAR